jgi:Family of unknown function (DUF5677)
MSQEELKTLLAKLLEEIGIVIDEDLRDVEPTLKNREMTAYIFFIRTAEIFKSISILLSTDVDQVIPAKILLRSLSEYYVLLKSSVEDKDFDSKHLKQAGRERIKWIDKTLKHHAVSGFTQDHSYFEEMKSETQRFHEEYESGLQPTYQLFEERNELAMYLNIYAPASIVAHGNRQSFTIYYEEGGGVKATTDRDYSSLLKSTGLAAGHVMFKAFELFCSVLDHKSSAVQAIETLLETAAAKIQKDLQPESEV